MLDPRFAILGAAIDLIGCAHYAFVTLKGETKPNRVTWLLWTTISFIAFAAEVQQGVGFVSLLTFAAGFGPAMVLVASFVNRKSYWRASKLDWVCGGLSALAIILWIITRTGDIAIIFAITADFLASVPTIIKAYRFPETENPVTYGLAVIASIITIGTITKFDVGNLGYPLYIFLDCAVLYVLIKSPQFRIPHAHSTKPQ